jgi:hypothetical protein
MAPDDRGISMSSFNIGDVDHMLEAALIDAKAGRNVYIETRTVRPGRPNERGKLEATIAVFAMVIDCYADRGKGGHINGDASAIIETSPGNSHRWLFLRRALGAGEAQALGIMIRKATGADHCTGCITQPFRVPGCPNFPRSKKIARGRITVPTRLIGVTDRTWTPDELIAVFTTDGAPAAKTQPARKAVGALNSSARKAITKLKIATKVNSQTDRSAAFQSAVNAAAAAGMTPDQVEAEMREHPDGPSRSISKVAIGCGKRSTVRLRKLNSSGKSGTKSMRSVSRLVRRSTALSCWIMSTNSWAGSFVTRPKKPAQLTRCGLRTLTSWIAGKLHRVAHF